MADKKIICFDLETTSTDVWSTEVLQCSIIDGNYKVLFNEYCKPVSAKSWPGAESVNHISPEMVKDKKTFVEYKDILLPIFNNADIVVTFNGEHFDIPIVERLFGFKMKATSFDVMRRFTEEFALYNHPSYKFRLSNVCDCFGIVNEKAHDALGDVNATLKAFYKMIEEGKKPKLHTLYKFDNGKEIYSEALAKEYEKSSGAKIVSTSYIDSKGEILTNPNKKDFREACFVKAPIV